MKILFVCSGNTCRSPLAESIARRLITDANRTDVEVASAGTNAWEGSPPSDGAMLVGMERGLDLSEHRSRQVTPEMVNESDLILVMSPTHLGKIREIDPKANARLLAGFAAGTEGHAIQDPFGGDLAAYRAAYDDIERELAGLLDRIPAT